jgi:putative ABC transport system permease protein
VIVSLLSDRELFALSVHINRERSKEVALRKIFGAPLYRIVGELTSRFLKWVLIAGALAIPLATWGMNEWLSNYAYRIRISFADILVPLGISLLIALAAIAGNVRKAASQNPLDTVRIE